MILELDDLMVDTRRYDICIIGAGAAGITLAKEFADTNLKVAVVEGGGRQFEHASQEPYLSEIAGLPHVGIHDGRARVLGGTTTLWAGQALPLFDVDFKERPWVPLSGWPITRDSLLPYYARAEQVMQIPHSSYDENSWPRSTMPFASQNGNIKYCFSQFASIPNFAKKYATELTRSRNIEVVLHANAISLQASENASCVSTLVVKSFRGKSASIEARVFIVCCGGIDSARLLLSSTSVEFGGIGNKYGVVGRYFQDHPTVRVPIVPKDSEQFDNRYSAVRSRSQINMIKMYPSAQFQESQQILNIGAEVVHVDLKNAPTAAAGRLMNAIKGFRLNREMLSDFWTVGRSANSLMAVGARKLLGQRGRSSAELQHTLLLSCEQDPMSESRIELSNDLDSLGMRRVVVNWRLSALVSRTIDTFIREIANQWRAANIAEVNIEDFPIHGREHGDYGGYADFNHHLGTTRMGTDPATSVVNSKCRVHGYDNLYIASSSVFPTGSFSNPTLTLLALCCRLADDIKDRLARSELPLTARAST